MKITSVLIFLIVSISSYSQITERYHPELKWKKFKTTHFDILFHEGTERSAKRLAEIAEDIYEPVTKAYQWEPQKKISWVLKDVDDYSNGGAYFLDHKIEIWTEHLDFDLRGTHDWLRNVVTHEFIHMIHIQKSFSSSLNIPFALLQWVGYESERRKDVVRGFPNSLLNYPQLLFRVPAWLAEGVAQHQINSARYDYRDSHREMVLRDRFLNNNVLSLEEMSSFGKTTIGNESSYNQGFSLVSYIVDRFGQSVLEKISEENSDWSSIYDYNDVFKRATGVRLDELYEDWKKTTLTKYQKDFSIDDQNKNTYIQVEGEANLYPKYSPNGMYVAYTSSEGSLRFSKNKLVLYNLTDKSKKILASNISSQISWFPSGNKILYSKQTEPDRWGSHYNDLYYYDLSNEVEVRVTNNCRARNATVNSKNEIVFITTYDGTSNIVKFKLSDLKTNFVLDQMNHKILADSKNEHFGLRKAWVLGDKPKYVTKKSDGTQFFHPMFKNDSIIITDMSNGYLRFISEINIINKSIKKVITGDSDYRNPYFYKGDLYFSSDKSGVYNIYKSDLEHPVTNVLGGAFMPTVYNDTLIYSEYTNGGYKIGKVRQSVLHTGNLIKAVKHASQVPKPLQTKLKIDTVKIERVGYNFNSYYIVPRIFIDDKHPKYGSVIIVNELLNKSTALMGASYNSEGERDIFGLFEFRNFSLFGLDPVFFVEGYNQTTKVDDKIYRKYGEFQFEQANRSVEFSLWQYEVGFKLKLWSLIDWRFAYINSRYHVSLDPSVSQALLDGGNIFHISYPFIRYNYHLGNSFESRFLFEQKDPSFTGEISPRSGYRIFSRISKNNNRFLDGFSTNTGFLLEKYNHYDYYNIYLKNMHNLPGFFAQDSFSLTFTAEGNFSETDDFYDVYAGGWIGLKGYPYFSIHGRHLALANLTYTTLLGTDLRLNAGLFRVKNAAISFLGEIGDAWTKGDINVKKDIGFQVKADTYGPLKFLFEGAYPLNELVGKQRNSEGDFEPVIYPKKWRFYLMLSYDFGFVDIL